jgi:hypothetical protein
MGPRRPQPGTRRTRRTRAWRAEQCGLRRHRFRTPWAVLRRVAEADSWAHLVGGAASDVEGQPEDFIDVAACVCEIDVRQSRVAPRDGCPSGAWSPDRHRRPGRSPDDEPSGRRSNVRHPFKIYRLIGHSEASIVPSQRRSANLRIVVSSSRFAPLSNLFQGQMYGCAAHWIFLISPRLLDSPHKRSARRRAHPFEGKGPHQPHRNQVPRKNLSNINPNWRNDLVSGPAFNFIPVEDGNLGQRGDNVTSLE